MNDTSNYSYWLTTLTNYGFTLSYLLSDPVHFDYFGLARLAQQNLIIYEKLYNINNPTNKIAEDGIYGPSTAGALYNAPLNGHPKSTLNEDEFAIEAFMQ